MNVQVDESECPGEKPSVEEPCAGYQCPIWYTGQWSSVSRYCDKNRGNSKKWKRCEQNFQRLTITLNGNLNSQTVAFNALSVKDKVIYVPLFQK